MSLTPKEKELISVGASLASGCKLCANYHFKKVRKAGATDEEIERAMADAIAVRDSAQKIMEWHGLKLLRRKLLGQESEPSVGDGGTTRMTELVSIAAAFAVNCTSSLEKHIEAARRLGVADDDIQSVVDIGRFIKGKADSYCCKLI
ncbi:MAG: carboxymuconolactone decarboxylase family protein [Gemmatimonadota bacterium]|nr:MAG: carboxymuconolactone decarboxylase family protein [Gemmatimonadota bacterium]